MTAQKAIQIRIRQICQARKITFNHLATISGVAPSTVKNIIGGGSQNTGIVTIAKLCNGLGITLVEFFDDDMFGSLEPEIH